MRVFPRLFHPSWPTSHPPPSISLPPLKTGAAFLFLSWKCARHEPVIPNAEHVFIFFLKSILLTSLGCELLWQGASVLFGPVSQPTGSSPPLVWPTQVSSFKRVPVLVLGVLHFLLVLCLPKWIFFLLRQKGYVRQWKELRLWRWAELGVYLAAVLYPWPVLGKAWGYCSRQQFLPLGKGAGNLLIS